MSTYPGTSLLLMGPPGSGKSTLACKACQHEGSAIIALAPGMDEEASYRAFRGKPEYIVTGYDDPEFFPAQKELKAAGFDKLIADLRAVYAMLQKGGAGPKVLVTDTFNAMSTLAMNKTYNKFARSEAPPAMSPDGAAFWSYYRNLQESLMRICRAIRGCGLHWIATCHVTEKEIKEYGPANPEQLGKVGIVPAISGGFRDVFPAGFDLVLYAGVKKGASGPEHFLRWQPDAKRPTKSRYGKLAETGLIANDWKGLLDKIEGAE